jgi:hypothetical protein
VDWNCQMIDDAYARTTDLTDKSPHADPLGARAKRQPGLGAWTACCLTQRSNWLASLPATHILMSWPCNVFPTLSVDGGLTSQTAADSDWHTHTSVS